MGAEGRGPRAESRERGPRAQCRGPRNSRTPVDSVFYKNYIILFEPHDS